MPTRLRIPHTIRERIVFVDTSAHYASIDKDDKNHYAAKVFLASAEEEHLCLVTSNFVVAETHALILNTPSLGYQSARTFLEKIRASARKPERITEEDEERAWEIIKTYDDKQFTYIDATSFALMQRLGIRRAFAFDQHFSQYGFIRVP